MRIDSDNVMTTRMIAAERGIPLSNVYWILNGKNAPDPLLDAGRTKFYSRKQIEKFFKTYRPKRIRGPNRKKRVSK